MGKLYDFVVDAIFEMTSPATENLKIVNNYPFNPEMKPLEIGMEIEKFFMYHIYILNFNSVIYRFDSKGFYSEKIIKKINARINGLPSSMRDYEVDNALPYPKNESDFFAINNWTIPQLIAKFEMQFSKNKIEYFDEVLLKQFHLIIDEFKCKFRCVLKSRYINTYPDVIVDNTIIDLKINSNFSDFKGQWKQLLNQYLDYQLFLKVNNIKYTRVTDKEKALITYPVNKLSLYYYRYNKVFTVDLDDLINEEILESLLKTK